MNPKPGDKVKIYFRENMGIVEGIVDYWSDEIIKLNSPLTKNILIINNCKRDVFLIKIINEEEQEKPQEYEEKPVEKQEEQESDENLSKKDLRIKKLVELQQLKAKEEREMVQKKLSTFENTGPAFVNYESPSQLLTKKPGIVANPSQKGRERSKENKE